LTGNDNNSPAAAEKAVTGASTLGNERASVPSSNHSRGESRPRHSRTGGETSTRCIQQPESSESPSSIFHFPSIRIRESTPVPSPNPFHSRRKPAATRHSLSKRPRSSPLAGQSQSQDVQPRLGQSQPGRSRQQRLGSKNILNTMDGKVRH
jgi:hypothetical protein